MSIVAMTCRSTQGVLDIDNYAANACVQRCAHTHTINLTFVPHTDKINFVFNVDNQISGYKIRYTVHFLANSVLGEE